VVIIDGHCAVDNPDYLNNLADGFQRSGADCLGRPQPLDVTGATPLQRAIAAARSSRLGHNPESFIYSSTEQFVKSKSVGVAYRRAVFDTVGCFDEDFDACEDVEFNHRLDQHGLRCFFTPKIRVGYYPRSSFSGLFRQLRRYGQGRARLLAKHPRTFTIPCFIPAIFILAVIAGPFVAWIFPAFAMLYAGAIAVYLFTILSTSFTIACQKRDWRLLPRLPLVFITIHAGAGSGILVEALWKLLGPCRAVIHRPKQRLTVRPSVIPFLASTTVERNEKNASPTCSLNALTVDVEDYYQVSAFESLIHRQQWPEFESRVVPSTHRILEVLERHSVRGTFFVLGYVAERHPELIRTIHEAGHEIGCHSYWHRLIYKQSPMEFRADLRHARDLLQDIIGARVDAYRAPSFSITRKNLWALDILIEEGFYFDSSIYPTFHDRYGIAGAPPQPHQINLPGGTIWEFPMAIFRKFGYPLPIGGGGYFRLYPYALTRHGLKAINALGRPFVVYIHPWELDPEQPRMNPGRLKAFRHYVNLHRTRNRLELLLKEFSFGTLSDVYSRLQTRGELPRWDLTAAAA